MADTRTDLLDEALRLGYPLKTNAAYQALRQLLASTAAAPDRSQVYRLAVQHGLIPAAIPAGYVLVPVEPTEAMKKAPANDRPGFSPNVAREVYAAMLAAAPATPAPTPEWRPIETAPKDGTWFIAFGPAGTEIVNEPPGCYIGHWKKGRKGWDGFGRVTSYPTHWMPLPTPPKD